MNLPANFIMLINLSIKNFAIIDNLVLEFQPNLTVLTGETGAGKSIIIDTLDLVLGARADVNSIRMDADRCEITAIFDLTNFPQAQNWLKERELQSDGQECIIRRSFSRDGRSRSLINDSPCTQQLARELGSLLVVIHGQHEHQSLLRRDKQCELLDAFAQNQSLCNAVKNSYQNLIQTEQKFQKLSDLLTNRSEKMDLISYQLKELESLELQDNEMEALYQELKQLSNAEKITASCNAAFDLLNGENENKTAFNILYRVKDYLLKISDFEPQLSSAQQNLDNAISHMELVAEEIRNYLLNNDLNADRLDFIEKRINNLCDVARKHRVKPEELMKVYAVLQQEWSTLENALSEMEEVNKSVEDRKNIYLQEARKLSESRKIAAQKLTKMVTDKMQLLGMVGGGLNIVFKELSEKEYGANGLEQIEFFVRTNPGQTFMPLNKIVSGGELSRISLAVQVVTAAATHNASTLIFDEVDVGVGGKTAEVVGKLLQELGLVRQVFCITHLPQVASKGSQHLRVVKNIDANPVMVKLEYLQGKERVNEIARMLGGINITETTLLHAKEMLHGFTENG